MMQDIRLIIKLSVFRATLLIMEAIAALGFSKKRYFLTIMNVN